MSYGKDKDVNNDTFRKVKPEYPIEEPYEDDLTDENPFETKGKSKDDKNCFFMFIGLVTVGFGSVIGIASVVYNALT